MSCVCVCLRWASGRVRGVPEGKGVRASPQDEADPSAHLTNNSYVHVNNVCTRCGIITAFTS